MKKLLVCEDFDAYKTGDLIEIEDQVALDAIVKGYAVPSFTEVEFKDETEKVIFQAPENIAFFNAPEIK